MRHLITLDDYTGDEIREILERAAELKAGLARGDRPPLLAGHVLSMIFEKPSLRTRNSFETAMIHLGGAGIFLSAKDAGLGGREELKDIARVLSGYSDVVALRTFSQQLIQDFAAHSSCPVINGLSDERHPCQALTDLLTIQEVFGDLDRHIVFVGDGNNVAASLAVAAARLGMPITVTSPPGYELNGGLIASLKQQHPGAQIDLVTDPARAVKNADVVYTDVWASMGQESEAAQRQQAFAPYQVNAALMKHAPAQARFMHDLPARRGLEVTDDVIDGPQSIAFQQAENRMHLAKGLIVWLLERV